MFFNFLWDDKPAKIKRSTIIAPICKGGLNMIDIYSIHTTSKSSWIKRIFSNSTKSKVMTTITYMTNLNKDQLIKKLPNTVIKECKCTFYKQVMQSWLHLYNTKAITTEAIINEFIFQNKYITINKKPIPLNKFGNNVSQNIKLINIINNEGTIMSLQELKNIHNFNINQLSYNSLFTAIPKSWKNLLRNSAQHIDRVKLTWSYIPYLKIGNNFKPVNKISSKEIYQCLILPKIETPTSISRWCNLYPFLDQYNWDLIYKLPYQFTKEPYLQSFQYKILHNILNCRE